MFAISRKKKLFILADIIMAVVFIALDRFAKYLAVSRLKDSPAHVLIRGVLELNYLENRGAAFGILQDQKIFLVLIAVLILFMICYVLLIMPDDRKYNVMHVLLVMLASGAVGNMIDRVLNGYVVDFISFVVIHFPIFNVADIYVTASCAMLVILFLFYYREHDFAFLSFTKQNKFREMK